MKYLLGFILKTLGVVLILLLMSGYGIYHYLFEKEYEYHEVRDPAVKQKLDEWRDLKFGLFMHWGPYSQWGVVESWSICAEDEDWCRRNSEDYVRYKSEYKELKTTFNPVDFNAEKWADAARDAGMKYMVFTTKHHDGFCMFDTQTTDYKITSPQCPFSRSPNADITRELFDAFRDRDFMVGAYYSKPDWNSDYFWWSNFATPDRNVNYNIEKYPERWQKYVKFTHAQVDELMSNYGNIDILWLDGGWVRPLTRIESSISRFVDGIFRDAGYTQLNIPQNQDMNIAGMATKARVKQPGLIVVDRFVEGPYENYLTPENHIPEEYISKPWESCITMHGGWSYNPNADYKSSREIIHALVDIASKGGSLLLNIGPSPKGTWHQEAYDILAEIGDWMEVNGAAIYKTDGRPKFSAGKVSFTVNEDKGINAIYRAEEDEDTMPAELFIEGVEVNNDAKVKLLGFGGVEYQSTSDGILIMLPEEVRSNPPCQFAWTFVIS